GDRSRRHRDVPALAAHPVPAGIPPAAGFDHLLYRLEPHQTGWRTHPHLPHHAGRCRRDDRSALIVPVRADTSRPRRAAVRGLNFSRRVQEGITMPEQFEPRPEHKFTFGLWTVGNIGRDPFGGPVREPLSPVDLVHLLADVGAYGVNFHDNDLVPIDATPAERDQIVRDFRQALDETGLVVPMATTNLFGDPAFKDGAFTANDPKVRAYALQKTMNAMDLGVELGAKIYVFWGGREGTETDASKDPCESMKRMREAMNFLCEYAIDQGYDLKFALEAKPNEPRGDMYLSTTGAMLGFIATLDHPEMVGVNPEVAHEHMAGLNFVHHVGQAW